MDILPYKITKTKDLLTSRAGLLSIAQLMDSIGFADVINKHFPKPQSNRGFQPSVFVQSLILMLHEGGRCLDDLRHLRNDDALRMLLGMTQIPASDSLGDWLRRTGQAGVNAVVKVNRWVLNMSLTQCDSATIDVDATLSASQNESAKWTYKKCKGYMPMVGHIAESGQVVAADFREGNVTPSTDNHAFIHQCEAALPEGITLKALRADAAAYQKAIIDECCDRSIKFAIRMKMSKAFKELILQQKEEAWAPLLGRNGKVNQKEWTTKLVHTMNKSRHSFTVVVQRHLKTGQAVLPLISGNEAQESFNSGQYIYRAIAVGEDNQMSNNDWVHWYNQRGEHSENRIKELKSDFAADQMPCQDFDANALYFALCTLAYNLFVLLRMHLPEDFKRARAKTVRWRLYALAGKVVRHGRQIYLKVQESYLSLLRDVLLRLKPLAQGP